MPLATENKWQGDANQENCWAERELLYFQDKESPWIPPSRIHHCCGPFIIVVDHSFCMCHSCLLWIGSYLVPSLLLLCVCVCVWCVKRESKRERTHLCISLHCKEPYLDLMERTLYHSETQGFEMDGMQRTWGGCECILYVQKWLCMNTWMTRGLKCDRD